jgi:hypothetical protein
MTNAAQPTDLMVANTILAQLGGNRFRTMTGAKNLVGAPRALQFRIGRGAKDGITNVQISLDDSDTYTVAFFVCRKFHSRLVGSTSFVHADQLRAVFEAATGLRTSL